MKHSQNLWKKLLSAALLGTVAAVPIMGTSTIAQAASRNDRFGYRDNNRDNNNQSSNDNSDSTDNNRKGRHRSDRSRGDNQPNTQSDGHQRWNHSNDTTPPPAQPSSQQDHRNYGSGNSHDSHANDSHDSSNWRPGSDSRDTNRSWKDNNSHTRNVYNEHTNNSYTVNKTNVNVRFRGNHDQDDNWHRSHGYVRNGSSWNWRGHDDDYWHNNGYSWNGSLWFRSGNFALRIGNQHQDYNWHRSHGYAWRGDRWYWRDHDDDYWLANGYFWNGTIWIIGNNNNSYSDYGSFRTFTGVVTHIDYGDNEFNIRIDDKIYNVYAVRDLPHRLNKGDIVQVHGQRYGNNDIRNSDFTITYN